MGQNVEFEFGGEKKKPMDENMSSDKSHFCSLCLAKHCSKFPPKVSVGT